MSLSEKKSGETTNIVEIKENPYKKRLMEMGFMKGKSVEVVRNSLFYPMILKLEESRYSIDKKLSNYIIVE